MTYKNCRKLIENTNKRLKGGIMTQDEYTVWSVDMDNKLDIFLLNNRITNEQYNELRKLLE